MTTPLEQIKERIESLKMRDDLKKDTRTCPVHMIDERIAYNEGLREGFDVVIENLPSIIQEVVEQAELQGRRTATGDFLKRVDETITRIRTIPTGERPDPVTALFLLKEESKCEGNCPNTCKVHMGEYRYCTNTGCLCHKKEESKYE